MKYRAIRIALVLLVMISITGSELALVARADDGKKRRVELKSVKVNGVDIQKRTADATVSVEIANPQGGFKIKDVKYRLKVNGEYAAEGKYINEIHVPEGATVTIDVPLTVSLTALPAIGWNTLTDGFMLRYEIETEFTVPVFMFITRKVKTTFTGEMPVKNLLSSLPGNVKVRQSDKP